MALLKFQMPKSEGRNWIDDCNWVAIPRRRCCCCWLIDSFDDKWTLRCCPRVSRWLDLINWLTLNVKCFGVYHFRCIIMLQHFNSIDLIDIKFNSAVRKNWMTSSGRGFHLLDGGRSNPKQKNSAVSIRFSKELVQERERNQRGGTYIKWMAKTAAGRCSTPSWQLHVEDSV